MDHFLQNFMKAPVHKRKWTLKGLYNDHCGPDFEPWSFKEVEDEIRKSNVRYECVRTTYRYHIHCRFDSMITTFFNDKDYE